MKVYLTYVLVNHSYTTAYFAGTQTSVSLVVFTQINVSIKQSSTTDTLSLTPVYTSY